MRNKYLIGILIMLLLSIAYAFGYFCGNYAEYREFDVRESRHINIYVDNVNNMLSKAIDVLDGKVTVLQFKQLFALDAIELHKMREHSEIDFWMFSCTKVVNDEIGACKNDEDRRLLRGQISKIIEFIKKINEDIPNHKFKQ